MQLTWCLLLLAGSGKADAGTVAAAAPAIPNDVMLNGDLSPLIELLSTSDGGFPFAKYKWQVPDLESYVDVPAVQMVNGLPVRFSAAVSKHDVPFLLDYYAKEFVRAGLFIPPPDDFKRLGLGEEFFMLAGLDTDNLISYTVMFQPISANQTTVIMGQGYLQEWLKRKKNPDPVDFAPLMPTAKMVVRSHSEGMELVTYATDASPKDVMGFYKETLPKAGYAASADEPGKFIRGTDQITVRATKTTKAPGQKADVPATAVMLQRRSRAPAP